LFSNVNEISKENNQAKPAKQSDVDWLTDSMVTFGFWQPQFSE